MAGAGNSEAASCGTVASPTSCSITVGGAVTFSFTNFAIGAQNGYQAGDISIDVATGGGLTGLLTFSKNQSGPTPGIVFFANPGESKGFSFSYDVSVSPAVAGTVNLIDPLIASIGQSSHVGTGLGTMQATTVSGPACVASTNSTQANCTLPGSFSLPLGAGLIVSLTGNTGNVSMNNLNVLYSASFTEPSTGAPEPTTYALFGLGLAAVGILRRKTR